MKKKLFFLCSLLFPFLLFSQIGIGTKKPHPSAIVDINVENLSSKKGILFPRAALTSSNDSVTIPHPDKSLVIYNTGKNTGFPTPGFYYWSGKEWRQLDSSTGVKPDINELQCKNATLTPPKYEKDKDYFGTITLPYTMGNGGSYFSEDPPKFVNGLKYELQPGKLNPGNGNIYYTVTGKPTVSSPAASRFELDFLNHHCIDSLGDLNEIKAIQYARKYTEDLNDTTYKRSVTSIGNVQVRYHVGNQKKNQPNFIEFKPIKKATHVTIKYEKAGAGNKGVGGQNLELWGEIEASTGKWYQLADDSWRGTGFPKYAAPNTYPDLNAEYRDIGTVLLVFHNTQEVYRVTLNVNGSIPANASKDIDPIKSGVTIFIEKLE